VKLLLKLFLIAGLLCAGIYLATPLWLSHVLARQLPADWQLEELQSGYPGLAGINIDLLRIKGELGLADVSLSVSDLRFEYRGLKSDIGLIVLDVYLRPSEKLSTDALTLNDFSLPVTKLTVQLPQLSVSKMRMALHQTTGIPNDAARPLLLDFAAFELTPGIDQAFHLTSQVTIAESPQIGGQLDVDVSPNLLTAIMHFPSRADLTPWLTLEMEQQALPTNFTSRIKAVLDADSANREWLDALLAGSTGRVFTQLDGKLEMVANFAGQEQQSIENLALTSENLHLVSDSGTVDVSTEIRAYREGEDIAIDLLTPSTIQYQGETDWAEILLRQIIPELQLTPGSMVKILSKIDSDSRFIYRPGSDPSLSFNGDISIDLDSSTEKLTLRSSGIQIETGDLHKLESSTADGIISLTWEVSAPFSYNSNDLQLEADRLTLKAELNTRGGKLVSKGSGKLTKVRLPEQDVRAEEVEMTWQNLDPIGMTGKLGTRTIGFSTEFDNQTWTGFDFDINYTLPGKNAVKGTGIATFANGQKFPFEFAGNTEAQRWNIKLLPAIIKLAKLRKLLSAAHYQLPDSIKLTDGYIELQGEVLVDDEVTAKLLISGHEVGAALHKSSARQTSFTFNAGYGKTPWVRGPVSIGAITLAGGVEVTRISSDLELENTERYGLKHVSAEVFDGQLKLASLQFSESQIEDTTIELSHINLGLLLAFADIDGLEGTGFLDISLPVGSDKTGFHVKDGTFRSTVPGRLAFIKEGFAASNIGLKALENFQYKELSGKLNYQSDGNYVLTIHLDGKNPDLYGGHPVVFNLNVNGLLPELFESMFMTGSFEESILKQIRSK
jgi:hypothetical protein